MTKEEIIEGNKLIAEFMGGVYHSDKFEIDSGWIWLPIQCMQQIKNLKYHTSWDWLMPVVEKIESLGYKWEIGMHYYQESRFHYCKIWSIGTIEAVSPIDAVYGAVIEFIKWYNNGKQI